MAVPDWPTTYGYNPFLYPWQTWIFGPWDQFIEHGHRLFGAAVGLLAIGLVIVVLRTERRRWIAWAACGALGLICFQGALGGMRVLFDKPTFARIHGCLGPLFFAYACGLACVTSRWWQAAERPRDAGAAKLQRLAVSTAAIAYLQIVIGAFLRDRPYDASASEFRAFGIAHLLVALALVAHIALVTIRIFRGFRGERLVRRPAFGLGGLVLVQVALGLATWVTHYGFPAWLSGYTWAANYVVTDESPLQIHLATAHVACGALIFGTAVVLAIRSLRLYEAEPRASVAGGRFAGAAA